ncbi:DUF2156 domain-containing protein [Nocardia pseudobrasiliensis]|uniref:Uncharacterized protein DUF2156 n=1 Tax=Nocardia pseudobrasiliensis TaxID=45979 RepID=A0A370IBP5_9NOCA|nr:DUF2156 domain-containing protein [Nocardia pseudobrasiliensis]RDI68146.1 uncharacterized protein DUF2156 [Nocardia pseudobrasiliensis]
MTATPARPAATSPEDALAAVRAYGRHSSSFLALNSGNEYFTVDGSPGMIVYRPFGRDYWVQFTGPIAPVEECARLQRSFTDAAARRRRRVIAVQLLRPDAEQAAREGYSVNQFGCSYSIDLSGFGLGGGRFHKTRGMVNRSRREGVTVTEADPQRLARPEFAEQLDAIDATWLRDKGRHAKELQFLIGKRGDELQSHRRLFVAELGGRPIAYFSFSPVPGTHSGWLADLERRLPDSPPGVVEHIFAEAAQRFRDEGANWLHLGLTPFVGLAPEYVVEAGHSAFVAWVMNTIRTRGGALYPAESALAFKLKWRPQLVTPEYLAVPHRIRLRDVWCLARVTNAL